MSELPNRAIRSAARAIYTARGHGASCSGVCVDHFAHDVTDDKRDALRDATAALRSATPAIDRATIMLALYEDGAYCGDCDYESAHFTADGFTTGCDDCMRVLGKYADTMLALIEGAQ